MPDSPSSEFHGGEFRVREYDPKHIKIMLVGHAIEKNT